jgi:hypothetical protein
MAMDFRTECTSYNNSGNPGFRRGLRVVHVEIEAVGGDLSAEIVVEARFAPTATAEERDAAPHQVVETRWFRGGKRLPRRPALATVDAFHAAAVRAARTHFLPIDESDAA